MNERMKRVERLALGYVERGEFSSVEWLALREGREWLRGAVGQADGLKKTPLPDKPIYRIYSMTKPIVSAIAMMLVEEGRLRLYDQAATYLPKFSRLRIASPDGSLSPARNALLVEHLLSHRSGLSYGFLPDCPAAEYYRQTSMLRGKGPLAPMVDAIADLPLAFEPGSRWRYSVGTDVVGRIIELIEGETLDRVIKRRIADPLGLEDTGFFVSEGNRSRIMPMFGEPDLNAIFEFDSEPQRLRHADIEDNYPSDDPEFVRGGYGLFSTVEEYGAIGEFLRTGLSASGDVLLSRAGVGMLWRNRIPDSQRPIFLGPIALPGYGFSLGGRVVADYGATMSLTGRGEFGWSGAASTYFWCDPDEAMTGVVMSQYLGSNLMLGDSMRNAAYQCL